MMTASGAGEYLLVKRGLYYRPGNNGYTGIKSEAGRYHESEAYPDGDVTAIHQDDAPLFSSACWEDVKVKHLLGIINGLERRIEATREVIEQGYRGASKAEKCAHDRYGFEECIACYDEALIAALDPSDSATPPQDKDA